MPSHLAIAYEKLKRKAAELFYNTINDTPFQFYAFKSYWHYLLAGRSKKNAMLATRCTSHFIGEKPNYGAGIGHQMGNWNAGYYFSTYYGLTFAHFPFSSQKWEDLLGFGENEVKANTLLEDKSLKKIRLPRFDCNKHLQLIENIINSYQHSPALFLLAHDQSYDRQCDTYLALSNKFFSASARQKDAVFYKAGAFNIAIHIRRGDVAAMRESDKANWKQRWLNNNYYTTVLEQVLEVVRNNSRVEVFIFSEGQKEDFSEFSGFDNIHYCLDVSAYDSFVHMVYADLLISSKSSFSYKPALLSKGIKISPADFWHSYPVSSDFILATNEGTFDPRQLNEALANKRY